MKRLVALLLCAFPLLIFAERIPTGYYEDADAKADSALKSALHTIISGGERYEYGTNQYHSTANPPEWEIGDFKAYGTWQAFPLTDLRSDGTIWDMYSNTKRYYPHKMGESGCGLNIEHCFPKSWWGGDYKDTPQGKDLYHLNPSDAQVNSNKNNLPLGVTDSLVKNNYGISKKGYMKGHPTHMVFEPADVYKGDFARAWFYIVTAYENLTWQSEFMDNNSYLEFQPWLIDLLLSWHRADPVSQKEIDRADVVSSIQHNRNPFIDYPDLIEYIWGNKKGQAVHLANLIRTDSSAYHPQEDFTNFALKFDTVSSLLSWNDFQTEYSLDIFTKSFTGHNDTIVNLPAITAKILTDCPLASYAGKINSNGTSAATMGSSSTDGTVFLHSLHLQDSATLVFRANMYNTATKAELRVYYDGVLQHTLTLPASRDEIIYRFSVPSGTDSISIASVGGSTTKRACMQELYLIQGNLTETRTSITGYPQTTSNHTAQIVLPAITSSVVYAQVSTQSGVVSNIVEIPVSSVPTPVSFSQKTPSFQVTKILHRGQVFVLRNDKKYNVLGQVLQ